MVSQATMQSQSDNPAACAHHWVIEIANGRTSPGRCRRCGEVRSFYNTFDDVMTTPGNGWSSDRKTNQG
jgi:hypothetical protein